MEVLRASSIAVVAGAAGVVRGFDMGRSTAGVVAPHGAAPKSALRQSGFYRSQVEVPAPLRISWNSEQQQPPLRRTKSEEGLGYEEFVNYETLDGSVGEEDVVSTSGVEHSRESFAKFLRHYPVGQLNLVSQACYLSNLAYIIGEIKVWDGFLLDFHYVCPMHLLMIFLRVSQSVARNVNLLY